MGICSMNYFDDYVVKEEFVLEGEGIIFIEDGNVLFL